MVTPMLPLNPKAAIRRLQQRVLPLNPKSVRTMLGLLTIVSIALAGCVERTISITSEPSGALVHLNDEEVGRTPLIVPFTFYGVYDVRVEHEPVWVSPLEAAAMLNTGPSDIVHRIETGELESRQRDGGEQVRLYYKPLWTKSGSDMPWWEVPGPDLIAEAIPNVKSQLKWHYTLEPAAPADPDVLVDHAQQMRALLQKGE
ncbi:MAG: PEGA domain-containing protein [Phycisphaeraceae bacterium]